MVKVNIGPYPSHLSCNIHSNYMEKKYGYNYDGNNNNFENFLEKLEDSIQYFYNIINKYYFFKKKQKQFVKIHNYDTWSMDYTLALIILPMLKQLQKTKQGSPLVDDEDVPVNIRSTSARPKKEPWDADEFYHKRWDYVLNEMIFAFEKELDDSWEYSDLSQENKQEIRDRQQKGFILFGKYYKGLWD